MKSFFRKIFSGIVSETKRLNISQLFLVFFLIVFFLSIAAYFSPQSFNPNYYKVENTDVKSYFDFFVRNGLFKVPYFFFTVFLVATLGQFILVKVFKKAYSLGVRLNVSLLTLGLLVSIGIYNAMPYYIPDLSRYDFDSFQIKTLIDEDVGFSETTAEFCGKRIDFFFAPYEGYSIKGFQTMKEVEKDISLPINYQCLAKALNEDILCERNHGIRHSPEMNELMFSWVTDQARPAIVLGCKYVYRGLYSVESYKQVICEKLGEGCE